MANFIFSHTKNIFALHVDNEKFSARTFQFKNLEEFHNDVELKILLLENRKVDFYVTKSCEDYMRDV